MSNTTGGDGVTATQMTIQLSESGSIPTSPLQFRFESMSAIAACKLNKEWHSRFPEIHWSNVVRNKHSICYGAKFDGNYFAVAIWSSPIARLLTNGENILELRRMAINENCPKNTASKMISFMVRDIKKRFPNIVKLISYQDTSVHSGTIYKASNWSCVNTMSKNVDWSTSRDDRSAPQSLGIKVRWELEIGENK
jgi:hypothetical protein